ncbi:MAG: RNA ligase family protein [Gemmatimonadota bacterium]
MEIDEHIVYPKMARLKNCKMTITEKIDGTNAQVCIDKGEDSTLRVVLIGSRKRVIAPNDGDYKADNFGFAAWVAEHNMADALGAGRHYGEWAGPGIQKNPRNLDRKLFFLFNTNQWDNERLAWAQKMVPDLRVVPIVHEGPFDMGVVDCVLETLYVTGSKVPDAGPGNAPEGIVVCALGAKFKKTRDDRPKGQQNHDPHGCRNSWEG